MDAKGYYAILGVSEHASYHEIKRSYRRLARRYHPDRNHSSFSDDMIKKINAAFEILSDRERRHEYDNMNYDYAIIEEKNENYYYNNSPNTTYNNQSEKFHSNQDNNIEDDFVRQKNTNNLQNEVAEGKMNDTKYLFSQIKEEIVNAGLLDTPRERFHIIVEPSLCMAFGSCETLAPKVFVVEKNKNINPKAKVESEGGATFERILSAAQTCPTKAIRIIDRYTGEQIYP